MDPITAGLVVGGVGAGLNYLSQQDANRSNADAAKKNIAMQEKFAKMGVRWKVEDARAAGIHPLAALGAQTSSFSPVSVGAQASDALGSGLMNMGQDLTRASMAKSTAPEVELQKLQLASAKLDLDGKAIDNQIRASQLQKMNSAPPPLPSAMDARLMGGQGNSAVDIKKSQITTSDPSDLSREAGVINDYGLSLNSTGGYSVVPSSSAKERMEDSMALEIPWMFRNNILPNYGFHHKGVPQGHRWNPALQQYQKGYQGPSGIHQLHPLYWAYRGYKKWKGGK